MYNSGVLRPCSATAECSVGALHGKTRELLFCSRRRRVKTSLTACKHAYIPSTYYIYKRATMNTIYSLFPLIRLCLRDQVLNWTPHKYHSDICNISLSLQEASWHSPSPVSTIDHTMGPRSSLSITRIKRCPPLRWSPAQPGLWEVMFFLHHACPNCKGCSEQTSKDGNTAAVTEWDGALQLGMR